MTKKEISSFEKQRIKDLLKIYSDPTSAKLDLNKRASLNWTDYTNAAEVREAIKKSLSDKNTLVQSSANYYTTNPIYATILNYLSNMFLWRYTIIPHKLYAGKNSRKAAPKLDKVYGEMMEIVEGMNLENKIPAELLQLFVEGSVYLTTYYDKESMTINTLILPSKYCRKVGETQFGTSMIKFDYTYFNSLGLSPEEKDEFLLTFPEEMQEQYKRFVQNTSTNRWQQLDPHYSSCVLLNEKGIPNYVYAIGSIINYERYNDNELQRNKNLLKYVVVHKMPLYQDQLIFDTEEVATIHKSLAKIINTNEDARLITTYGEVHIDKIAEDSTTENKVLENAYKSIYDNNGLNNTLFTGNSVEALKYSLRRDQAIVWSYVEQLMNFYNLAINNHLDFGGYQAEINMLRISHYTYQEDIESYRENATLGVAKLDYLVAAGIKQKNIQDRFELEDYLGLINLKPLQSSYTQTSEDTDKEDSTIKEDETKIDEKVEIKEKDEEEGNEETKN